MNIDVRLKAYIYYALSVTLLCVIILRDITDPVMTWGVILSFTVLFTFVLAAWLRGYLIKRYVIDEQPLLQPKRQFYVELGVYFIAASVLSSFAWLTNQNNQFSISLFMWPFFVGYFASIECALGREYDCFQTAQYNNKLESENNSFAGRLNMFISATVLIVIIACAQTAYGYMELGVMGEFKQGFMFDILFIIGLTVSLSVRIIYSYSVNLQHLFDTQLKGLKSIQEGKIDRYVPVQSSDELGLIAQQTNMMIDELRDKEKIQKMLEQTVSPDIMKKLLNGDAQDLKNGQEHEITILFCDLRRFTTYTENTPSEEVIFFLNAYFSKIADLVAEHNGIINKFMGDAILAVFGVEGNENYIEDAVETAWDILEHSNHICMKDGTTFDIGIGVHKGLATACTIGSSERFEYTFIGDAVNTASRLDGLCKDLGYKVLVSHDVFRELDRKNKSMFVDLGTQEIRGKYTPLRIHGAEPTGTMKNKTSEVIQLSSRRSAE